MFAESVIAVFTFFPPAEEVTFLYLEVNHLFITVFSIMVAEESV